MNKKFIFTFFIAVFILLIGGIGFSYAKAGNQLVFTVTVPKTTPADDAIFLHYREKKILLSKIANRQYQGTINTSNFFIGEILEYHYSRGGLWYFGEKGARDDGSGVRIMTIGASNTIQDTVKEWRWLPSEPLAETDIQTQAGKKIFKPRKEFWKGVQFVDFWEDAFPYQYPATIKHLKKVGFQWVSIAPPWDIKNTDPPKISNINVNVPVYPDKQLRNFVRTFKKADFQVMFRIQVCCEPISFDDRSESWWKKWYDEYENFVKYHADLAKATGVDALVISDFPASLPLDPKSPSFASARWKKIIEVAKTSGALIGFETLAWGASYEDILPPPSEFIDFWDDLDFVGVSLWGDITKKTNPSQKDMDKGMKIMMNKLDALFKKVKKPIVLIGVAYDSVKGAGLERGDENFYTWEEPENIPVQYSAAEQAMIYEALMKVISEKKYITGVFPFGYWYLNAPGALDTSIRDKMAERILSQWFKNIPNK